MKKLLLTILFTLVLSENVICKEYSVHSGDYKWSFTKNSKNEDEIKIEVENVSSTQQKIYTNFLIYDNCSSEKKLIDTIDIESQIGKQLSEPFEILDFRIKPSIDWGFLVPKITSLTFIVKAIYLNMGVTKSSG